MRTIGELLKNSMEVSNLDIYTIESNIKLPHGILSNLLNDNYYTNSVPIILFRDLILFLNISIEDIKEAMIPTFRLIVSKETLLTIKNKSSNYLLWENEESVNKYSSRLEELYYIKSNNQ